MCEEAEELYTMLHSNTVKARKIHQCCACDESIEIGHQYVRTFGLFDGGAESYKHCLRCWAMLEAIRAVSHDNIAIAWQLDCGELWADHFGDIPEDVAKLAFLTQDEAQTILMKPSA